MYHEHKEKLDNKKQSQISSVHCKEKHPTDKKRVIYFILQDRRDATFVKKHPPCL